jgi:hypothetical protein
MPITAKLLNGTRREYTIGHLVESTAADPTMPQERRLLGLVLPPWQRPEVWTIEQKRRFVEGIFLGLGCGYYVTNGLDWVDGQDGKAESAPMSGWLLDGQQRIAALRDFLADDLVIFGDVTFSSLPQKEAMRFKRENFPCFEIAYTNNEDVLKELYDRLNFGGTAHTLDQRVAPSQRVCP